MTSKTPALAADNTVANNKAKSDTDSNTPCCGMCGSQNVVRDAWAEWNGATREWELDDIFDDAFCKACVETTKIEWKRPSASKNDQIRDLNDALRTGASDDGLVVITSGIQSLGPEIVIAVRRAVATFTSSNGVGNR